MIELGMIKFDYLSDSRGVNVGRLFTAGEAIGRIVLKNEAARGREGRSALPSAPEQHLLA
ncbi:hypothetical protein GWG65_17220 [Bradyrhizobium sp. CSA207]|uniref:hypothetical protein n=1 Tax=Bradyrhizobium sp. CSA207 TaxID=2698826 RepID=UPI0023AF07B1|nr:hypothetical protein [Bradyrhizobium sp. CSA207]MDE5443163.1 hypothetical protein [Bradyrhizobium sp. CSA207]